MAKKYKDLTITEIRILFQTDWFMVKGDFLYVEGNAYNLEWGIPEED